MLGVSFDKNLNFSGHISEMCKKTSKKVGVPLRLRNLIPCFAKLMIYKTSTLPFLTYFHVVWHFCKASDSRKVERIQERALREVYKTKLDTYETHLNRARLPTLHNRRLQDIGIYMNKVKTKLSRVSASEIFTLKQSSYSLKNSDFNIIRFNIVNYGKHSLNSNDWNFNLLQFGMQDQTFTIENHSFVRLKNKPI